jgi:hypothetical protein
MFKEPFAFTLDVFKVKEERFFETSVSLTQRHNVTFQKTWILDYIKVKTSHSTLRWNMCADTLFAERIVLIQ